MTELIKAKCAMAEGRCILYQMENWFGIQKNLIQI